MKFQTGFRQILRSGPDMIRVQNGLGLFASGSSRKTQFQNLTLLADMFDQTQKRLGKLAMELCLYGVQIGTI